MSLVPGYGEGTFDLLMLLDESVCDIYVSAAGTAGDTDLPNALASVTGRTDWIKTDIMLSVIRDIRPVMQQDRHLGNLSTCRAVVIQSNPDIE